MSEFKGTIELIGGITPKNSGNFPLVNSPDVELPNGERLSDMFVQTDSTSVVTALPLTTFTPPNNLGGVEHGWAQPADQLPEFAVLYRKWYTNWKSAVVVYDGQVYQCERKMYNTDHYIGNGALAVAWGVEESSEPFLLLFTNGIFMMICETGGEHKMSVTLMYDKKYVIDETYVSKSYDLVEGTTYLEPGKYYDFGNVDDLSVKLIPVLDGKVHEYCFEFRPSENCASITIEPTPKWVNEPQIVPGKTHQVSIVRGIGVIVCA